MNKALDKGRRYRIGDKEFMTVAPRKYHWLCGSTSLQKIMDSKNEVLVVNLSNGSLTTHAYPTDKNYEDQLILWYITERTGAKHKVFTSSLDAAVNGIIFLHEHYGRGTVTCFEQGRSFVYDPVNILGGSHGGITLRERLIEFFEEHEDVRGYYK